MRFWQAVLFGAAGYNLVVGVGGLVDPVATTDARIVSLLVACFGVVYALVGTDIARFKPMLWAGVIGKLGVIAIVGPEVASGVRPAIFGPVLAGDALFTIAFLWLLLTSQVQGRK